MNDSQETAQEPTEPAESAINRQTEAAAHAPTDR